MEGLLPAVPWLHPLLAVGLSAIQGQGLFATGAIPAGTTVVAFGGRLATDAELDALIAASDQYVDTLSVEEDLNLVLPGRTPVGYGNHSCEPNLWWGGFLSLTARRDLLSGDEATVDYGTLTDSADYTMACICGSSLCRGHVTGQDWRLTTLQQRYGTHWVPALRRRIDAG